MFIGCLCDVMCKCIDFVNKIKSDFFPIIYNKILKQKTTSTILHTNDYYRVIYI